MQELMSPHIPVIVQPEAGQNLKLRLSYHNVIAAYSGQMPWQLSIVQKEFCLY